jgi:hypothetical protein
MIDSMANRRRDVRAILTMDANEAMDKTVFAYLGLFKRRPLLMHAIGIALLTASFVLLWNLAGLRSGQSRSPSLSRL